MEWIRRRIADFILDVVFREVRVGGHCGCCGQWVEHDLVWAVDRATLCRDCLAEADDD